MAITDPVPPHHYDAKLNRICDRLQLPHSWQSIVDFVDAHVEAIVTAISAENSAAIVGDRATPRSAFHVA